MGSYRTDFRPISVLDLVIGSRNLTCQVIKKICYRLYVTKKTHFRTFGEVILTTLELDYSAPEKLTGYSLEESVSMVTAECELFILTQSGLH